MTTFPSELSAGFLFPCTFYLSAMSYSLLSPYTFSPELSAMSWFRYCDETNRGIASVKVKTQPGCDWTAASGASWLIIIDGGRGVGSGVITYSAESNDTYEPRTAISTFAGKVFTVKQKGMKTLR
jgi:hypothetical protein